MAVDTTNWTEADLVKEAKLQTEAIKRLDVWLRLGYSSIAVGFLLGYWGLYGAGGTTMGVIGVVVLVIGVIVSVVLKTGTTHAKANVKNMLAAAGVDLDKKEEPASEEAASPGTHRKAKRS